MVAVRNYLILSGLKTMEMCPVTVLEVRSLTSVSPGWKQGVSRATLPLKTVLCFLQLLVSARHPLARGCITLIFKASIFRFLCFHLYIIQSSVCVCLISLCLTLIRVHVITWRVHLNLITSTKTLSPNEVTITGSRNQDPISLGPLSAKHNI